MDNSVAVCQGKWDAVLKLRPVYKRWQSSRATDGHLAWPGEQDPNDKVHDMHLGRLANWTWGSEYIAEQHFAPLIRYCQDRDGHCR